MANVFAIHSVCQSVVSLLQDHYPASLAELPMPPCRFEVLSPSQLATPPADGNRVGLCLYRAAPNTQVRPSRTEGPRRPPSLPLDLHFLVVPWSASAQDEQVLLAWTMRQLALRPVLDVSSLTAEAGWAADETIEIVPADLSTGELLQLWSALGVPYRLCAPYISRLVRIEADPFADPAPVLVQPSLVVVQPR